MGRHRRSAAGRAATGRATEGRQTDGTTTGQGRDQSAPDAGGAPTMGIAPYLNPEAYAEVQARSDAYLFAAQSPDGPGSPGGPGGPDGEGPQAGRTVAFPRDGYAPDSGPQPTAGHRRRRKKAATPVRTGLLGVSAAVAIGTVAVATGAVPGLDNYRIGGGSDGGDRVQAQDAPTNSPSEQGGASGSAETGRGGDASTSRGTDRSSSPSQSSQSSPSGDASSEGSPSTSPSSASPSPSAPASKPAAPAETPSKTKKPKTTPSAKPKPTPSRPAAQEPTGPSAPAAVSEEAVAQAQVLKLVNAERAKVGCSPVAANSALRELAEDFSEAMGTEGFFDHTDPGGATPWDRAAAAGISGLGGENIARGQADAQAVMDAWMDSPDHRANILNCDFQTLGVGVHFGSGGPWWTQDFGY
ncbi:CAP domain-containing protein [Streptomyces sp. AC512_CC834]|uniref:CAP domain-containing protein n=1 Tax=Streptomyces sp. AC512_CC834 TaxID=2823691 RepID=UPI001C278F05|nr:CAP domain-containing protein [Streptomyces sp. AC512_CC834]